MKKIIKIIICLVVMVSCFTISYGLLKNRYEKKLYSTNIIRPNVKISPSSVLRYALISKDWSNISLSENFKSKYKSKYDIIPNARKYKDFSCGYEYVNGKRMITISTDIPASIFDFDGADTTTTEFYFDYTVVDNMLDDIKLIEVSKYKTMTCELIETIKY